MEIGDDTPQEPPADDESVEDFKQEIENDPSTAHPTDAEDDDVGRLRGG
jgi:hypothetical protein